MWNVDFFSKSRILAIVGFLLAVMVISLELTGYLGYNQVKIVSDCILLVLFLIIIIFPKLHILFSVSAMIAAYVNIRYGGNLLGLLLYAFALSMAMKQGFFRKNKRFKIPLVFIVFAIFLLFQFNLSSGIYKFIISIVNILIGIALIIGFLYMFNDNLKGFYSSKPLLDIRQYNFTERQIACIRGCLNLKKLKTVAEEQLISESAIKREMLAIYEALQVEDRYELYRLLMEHTVVFE